MRVQSLVAAALLSAAGSHADAVDTPSEAELVKPTFTPTNLKAPFLEQFTDDWETRWTVSSAKKESDPEKEEEWQFIGKWSVEEPTVLKGIEGDNGLVLKDKAAHHAISAIFPKKIDNKGKTLVIQYEVKFQNGLECGGAYMKLLQDNKALKTDEFSNASPYVIMFGPDKCGSTNKVHFIFKHKNPKTGEYEEKHLKAPPAARITKTTTLYTLIIRPDQTYEMRMDGDRVKNGSLLEDFNPPVMPEKEIEDENDEKPADWVDNAKIPDSSATKPEDWDESEPFEVPDMEATKPADWLENEPTMIPDPEAEKPEDWDDEEDGDWVPPAVPNPKCIEASGCGEWKRPTKRNPNYKGKWTAPMIDNPEYKGVWKRAMIPNPEYFEDKTPSDLEPMGGIGFELWTMQNDILFDNIYIGHSEEDAEALAKETYTPKRASEKAEDALLNPPDPEPEVKSPLDLKFADDPLFYIKEKWELFITIAKRDPVEAVKFVPEIAGALGAAVVFVLSVLLTAIFAPSAAPSKEQVKDAAAKAKAKAVEAKDQAAEAVATGAEKAKEEVNKRTTRSSAQQ